MESAWQVSSYDELGSFVEPLGLLISISLIFEFLEGCDLNIRVYGFSKEDIDLRLWSRCFVFCVFVCR